MGPKRLLAIMLLSIFLHHNVRMYDIFWAYLVPEINYSSSFTM